MSMNITKTYADPNISRQVFHSDHVGSAIPNSFPLPQKASENANARHTVVVSGQTPQVLVKNPVNTAAPAPTNPYGNECGNLDAFKAGLSQTDCGGLDQALASQEKGCCPPQDSFCFSPQAMLYCVMQDLMKQKMMMAMMSGGMGCGMSVGMPGGCGGWQAPMTAGWDGPINANFGCGQGGFDGNAVWSFSSFSAFWGGSF